MCHEPFSLFHHGVLIWLECFSMIILTNSKCRTHCLGSVLQSFVHASIHSWPASPPTGAFNFQLILNPKNDPSLRMYENIRVPPPPPPPDGEPRGGGTLIFSSYVGSGPASAVHPKKYQEFQAPQKNIWNFSKPPENLPFCTLTLWKDPEMHRNKP